MYLDYKPHLKKYSQINRKIPTKSEGLTWNTILKGDRTGYRFLRQKPVEGYILDFYCSKLKLVVEIDGISHEDKGEYDEQRDKKLQSLGIKVIRYREKDVLKNLEAVSIHINTEIEERAKELESQNPPSLKPACCGQGYLPLSVKGVHHLVFLLNFMKKINESFICINCGKEISQAAKTCRNHCPYCFVSRHVDGDIPGDRATTCGGTMYPINYEIRNGGMKIQFQCKICGKTHRNKRADDDEVENLDTFIKTYKEILY